jgi:hypothetical protein
LCNELCLGFRWVAYEPKASFIKRGHLLGGSTATYFSTGSQREDVMDRLRQFLQRGRNGNAVLFCGAGLTADCLNFEDDSTLGVTFHLLQLLNDELKANGKQSGFKDIRNAAKRFSSEAISGTIP